MEYHSNSIRATIRALGDEIMIMKSDMRQLVYEAKEQKEHIKDNIEKVKVLYILLSPLPSFLYSEHHN